ncbi:MAG: family 20 glycosylhydrolase [Ignavibacteriaceae bacterium]
MSNNDQQPASIVPLPQHIEWKIGKFIINENTVLLFDPGLTELEPAIWKFVGMISNAGIELHVLQPDESGISENFIRLVFTDLYNERFGKESYNLSVNPDHIIITASASEGLFYGLQTLRSLLNLDIESDHSINTTQLIVPCVEITDYPKFQWRGLMLDCCRHFLSKDFIKRYIDLLALHKMNRLHLHLTDDQGWRLEIKKYPQLTNSGAWRKNPDGERYGGYYTQEDIKEIVEYAGENFITIIPEIELPGHCTAVLSVFPEFSCSGGPFEVGTQWGVYDEVFCAGNDSVFLFLENVFSEVINLFPGRYIHIGGDEVPKNSWKNCPKCQRRIKTENLQNEEALQSYFINRIVAFLTSKGKEVIGWDEVIEGGLNPQIIVQSWRGLKGTTVAVKKGNYAISSPTDYAYFDYDIGIISLEDVYNADPIPENLTQSETEFVLGGECNMWTEYAPQEKIDSKVFPRILAMAEVLWTYPNERNFEAFFKRVHSHYKRLSALNVRYGPEARPLKVDTFFDQESDLLNLMIKSSDPDYRIFFTTDESDPDQNQQIYKNPVGINSSCFLKAQAYRNELPYGEMLETKIYRHLGNGISPILKFPFSPKYNGGGEFSLTNGLTGSARYNDGNWQGFQLNDFVATIAFANHQQINFIQINFLRDITRWIFLPEKVFFYGSEDGINFNIIKVEETRKSNRDPEPAVVSYKVEGIGLTTKFIRISAKNIGKCPQWHPGAGGNAWLFTDEIIIN